MTDDHESSPATYGAVKPLKVINFYNIKRRALYSSHDLVKGVVN